MAIVFARPGTPSTRRWPRARRATIIRSSRWSWPTMTFLTSYSSRSIGTASGPADGARGSWSTDRSSVRVGDGSVVGQAGAATGDVDGHGQADADEHVLLGGVDEGGDDADHPAIAVEQGSARVAGVHGGVDLDEPGVDDVCLRVTERPLQAGHDAVAQGAVQAERVADGERLAPDLERRGVAEQRRDDDGGQG